MQVNRKSLQSGQHGALRSLVTKWCGPGQLQAAKSYFPASLAVLSDLGPLADIAQGLSGSV